MTRLVFLENREQVLFAKQSLSVDSSVKLVSVTGEAIQAIEACGLPHEPVSVYADARRLASVEAQLCIDGYALACEIESFIAQRYSLANFEGPGFLSGQGYYIFQAINEIATRSFLMNETIRACAPEVVTVFDSDIYGSFSGDEYGQNPWLDIIATLSKECGFQLEIVPQSALSATSNASQNVSKVLDNRLDFLDRIYRYARRRAPELLRRLGTRLLRKSLGYRSLPADELIDVRLLMVDCGSYDWAPLLQALRWVKGGFGFRLEGMRLDGREQTYHYTPYVRGLWNDSCSELEIEPLQVNEIEAQSLSALFDEWLSEQLEPPILSVLGMNLFPSLVPYFRSLVTTGPSLVRYSDAVANRALAISRPHAVCFFGMPWLASKRFAFQCRQREIPVVCYQHGGTYGTHMKVSHELMELGHADYFLTYGIGVRVPASPSFPIRARYVSIGSTRIERMMAKSASHVAPASQHVMRVLWVAETSGHNIRGGTYQVEDTHRYLIQTKCLSILDDAGNLSVIYRPFVNRLEQQGTPRWIERNRPSIRIDSTRSLEKLIRAADIVISDISSSTAWNEVLALGKPLILYCDPEQTRMYMHFMEDLKRACYWCKSEDALVAAVQKLAMEGAEFVEELRQIDTTDFVRDYILHRDDERCVQRVISFLENVCRKGIPVAEWIDSNADVEPPK